MRTAEKTGAQVSGPIPLPVKTERWTVLRSPHVDKKSREQFELRDPQAADRHPRLAPADDGRADQARSAGGRGRRDQGRVGGMTNGLIGRKLGMTRVFAEDGTRVPVTVIEAGPCRVVQVRDERRAARLRRQQRRARRPRPSWATPRRPASTPRRACCASFGVSGEAPAPGDDGHGRHLRRRRAGQGDRHDQGPRLPGRGAPLRLRRRSRDARQHAAPQAGLDRARHRSVARHQGQADARPHGRRAAHRAGPHAWCRSTPSATCCSCAAPCPGPMNGMSPCASREGGAAMIEAPHFSAAGAKQEGAFALPEALFDGTVNEAVLHQAVTRTSPTSARARTRPRPAASSRAATRSRGARRAPAARARARPARRTGGAAASCSARSRATTARTCRAR